MFGVKAQPSDLIAYNQALHHTLANFTRNRRIFDQLEGLIDQLKEVVLASLNNVKKGNPRVACQGTLPDFRCAAIASIEVGAASGRASHFYSS